MRALLSGGAVPEGVAASLDAALEALERHVPGSAHEHRLAEAGEAAARREQLAGGPRASGAAPRAERLELERDRLLVAAGERALHEALRERPGVAADVEAGRARLEKTRFATLLADRDGTVLPYFSRYGASVQSAWGALCLTRMARRCSGRAVVLTAGPLQGPGVADLAVAPAEDLCYAASKGREWMLGGGAPHREPLEPEQSERMRALGAALERLLDRPDTRRFRLIGSGLQLKYGQATVARQDVAGRVPEPESEALLEELRALVRELDSEGRWLRLEDTGFDVEIHLAAAGGEAFDKGDGVRLLQQALPLGLESGPALVCGDTLSDVPMLEAAAAWAPEVRAAFVIRPADPRGEAMRRAVREQDPDAVFVSSPEALLLLLDALAASAPSR